ncbi:MAG: thioredoxin family protein [Myxococcaceae bacterium]|nr:thioredoxin family protein [Myxococcaceae bacterium]
MAATPSTMLPLGTALPPFTLPDAVTGKPVASSGLTGPKGVLVMFICNHCPYVIHIRQQLVALAHRAVDSGLSVVAINANSTRTHPQDGPEHMKSLAQKEGWRFPFLFDETQDVARAFQAVCTPDLFLFDARRSLAYRGQFDDSRPSNGVPVTGKDLGAALDQVLAGKAPAPEQRASIGCNIKWHPG